MFLLVYRSPQDCLKPRMHRFVNASYFYAIKSKTEFVAFRYLIQRENQHMSYEELKSGGYFNEILLSTWLTGCGKFYFIIYNEQSKIVYRERAKAYDILESYLVPFC